MRIYRESKKSDQICVQIQLINITCNTTSEKCPSLILKGFVVPCPWRHEPVHYFYQSTKVLPKWRILGTTQIVGQQCHEQHVLH